jgi:hypothetical protein
MAFCRVRFWHRTGWVLRGAYSVCYAVRQWSRKPVRQWRWSDCLATPLSYCPTVLMASICLLAACVPVRPMIKIGLMAPFEGLYRRTGYEALAAMRLALTETPIAGVDLLPLALDTSIDPQRAAQKLLADQRVRAVVGPQSPELFAQIAPFIDSTGVVWVTPYAIDPASGQFVSPTTDESWATGLVVAVVHAAQNRGNTRLVLAGWTPGWPQYSVDEWTERTGLPVVITNETNAVQSTDVIFWMGNAADGADYLARLRAVQPTVPFWLGPQGSDPVFAERVATIEFVYWATWLGEDYAQWAVNHTPATPTAYLVYQATRQAIARISKAETGLSPNLPLLANAQTWVVHFFTLEPNGISRPLEIDSGN